MTIMATSAVFLWGSSVQASGSVFRPSLGLFSFRFFVLYHSDVLVFILSCYIYYYPTEACIFSNERQNWGGSGWEGSGGESGVGGGETVIRRYCVRKESLCYARCYS